MINGLIAIGYKDIWDDYDSIQPLSVLESVPTIGILDYIVERQNEVLFAFSDIESHRNRLLEMRCYLSGAAQLRFDEFYSNHENISLFSCEGNFLLYKLALQQANTIDRKLTSEDIAKIYKAYLYCNQTWSEIASENFDQQDIDGVFIRADLPIAEFKLYKDFRPQFYKAINFFKFCENDETFKEFLQWFCEDRKCSDWKEYLSRWICFLEISLKSKWIKFDDSDKGTKDFFNLYAIDTSDCHSLWNTNDQYYLRNHFLYHPKDNLYLLLNHNLMVDKFYQGMKFDVCSSIIFHNGKDDKGNIIKDIPSFNSLLGRKFSESAIFYDLMHKSFDGCCDVILSGEQMHQYFEKDGEPDFYIRKGSHAFVFEYKDITLGNNVKFSTDIEEIKTELKKRICKGGGKGRKGAGQLLHSIDAIINRGRLEVVDPESKNVDLFYPIVVTTDRSFSALGVNKMIIPDFVSIAREYDLNTTHIAPVVIVDFDTLFMLCKRLHDKVLDFEVLIKDYISLLLTSPGGIDFISSFYSYVYDNYRNVAIDAAENEYLYGNIFEEFE